MRSILRRLAKAYGMKVVAIRRRPNLSAGDELLDQCFGPDQLKELMSVSDYVVCSAPLTASTSKFGLCPCCLLCITHPLGTRKEHSEAASYGR